MRGASHGEAQSKLLTDQFITGIPFLVTGKLILDRLVGRTIICAIPIEAFIIDEAEEKLRSAQLSGWTSTKAHLLIAQSL